MPFDSIGGGTIVLLLLAIFIIISLFLGVRIVPQSQKYVVERFGRLRAVLGPGINLIVPFVDTVAHKVSILERQLPNQRQDAITTDNVLVQVETSVFYRIMEPEKTVYRIRDVDAAILTTVAGIVRSEIGTMELDEVQSNRARLTQKIGAARTFVNLVHFDYQAVRDHFAEDTVNVAQLAAAVFLNRPDRRRFDIIHRGHDAFARRPGWRICFDRRGFLLRLTDAVVPIAPAPQRRVKFRVTLFQVVDPSARNAELFGNQRRRRHRRDFFDLFRCYHNFL